MPEIRAEGLGAVAVQKDAVVEASSQTWLAGALCYTTAALGVVSLNGVISAGTVIYGQSPDSAVGSGASTPPSRLFGLNHFCFDVRDRILEINIANTSASGANTGGANGVTWAGGGTSGVALAPGQQYGIVVPTSGTYQGYQFLDVTNTSQKLFEIVALAPNQAITDNNPRVWVKVISTVIQG